jgi:hypothetical protein
MSVNHFLWTDERLLEELTAVVEEHTYADEAKLLNGDPNYMVYDTPKSVEYHVIIKEILSRMNR